MDSHVHSRPTEGREATGRRNARVSCDPCRTKKLRCSGEHPICLRCSSGNYECTYSRPLRMGRPRTKKSFRQAVLRPETSQATLPPSTHPSSTRPTIHSQNTSPIRRASVDDWENGDGQYESTPQGSIPRLFDITSAINSETPYLDDVYHVDNRPQNRVQLPTLTPNLSTPRQPEECACPSVLYLLLEQLRTKTDWVIPDDLEILRNCKEKALGVVSCNHCPLRYFSVIQNGLILGVVTTCIAECYGRLLEQIDQEELRATSKGEKKLFDISNIKLGNPPSSTPPSTRLNFTVEVEPSAWRESMRNIIKSELYGVQGRRESCFMAFVAQLEERQKRWHQTPPARDCPSHYRSSCNLPDRVPSCLIVIDDTKRLVNNFHL